MEFLMTYGWAILVVLIAIGALAYFGVLNPSRFLPKSCTIEPGFACEDFKVTSSGAQLLLRNGKGENLNNVTVVVAGCDLSAEANGAATWTDGAILGGTDGITTANCPSTWTAGSKAKADVSIVYTSSSGLSHNATGQINTEVE